MSPPWQLVSRTWEGTPGSMQAPQRSSAHVSTAARTQLERRVAWHAVRGAVVVYRDDTTTVLAYRKRTNHTAHGIATLTTLGLWAPGWALFTMAGRIRDRGVVIMIDKYGLVHEEAARKNQRTPARHD